MDTNKVQMKTAICLGGNGFISHHMARRLKSEGYWVRCVDIKEYEYGVNDYADEIIIGDLRNPIVVEEVLRVNGLPFDEVYVYACLMGGAGFVFSGENDAEIMHDSALINLNVVNWCAITGAKKVFYSSSACMYPQQIQTDPNNKGLKESDAWPLNPDSVYGLEKAFSEQLYTAYQRNHNLNVRIARFHNIYGEEGTYKGGKEKAPAAMCRKVIDSSGSIEIFGTGEQTRSFLYIDDCIDAVRLLMESDFKEPINIGSEEMVTINQLADLAIEFSGKTVEKKHIDGPIGVMGRNSNNDLIRQVLNGWEPKFTLRQGLKRTYNWINQEINGLPS